MKIHAVATQTFSRFAAVLEPSRELSQHVTALALCVIGIWLAAAPQTAQAQSCNVGGVAIPCVSKEPQLWTGSQSIYGINSSFAQNSSVASKDDVIGPFLSKLTSAGPPLLISSSLLHGWQPTPPLNPVGSQHLNEAKYATFETVSLTTSYGPYYQSMVAYPSLPQSGPVTPVSGALSAARLWICPTGTSDAVALTGDTSLAGKCLKPQVCSTDKPVDPLYGLKRQTVVDYQGAGAHPLNFTRTYTTHSDSSGLAYSGFAKTQADPNGTIDGTDPDTSQAQHWQHNYSSLVWFNAYTGSKTACPGPQPQSGFRWDINATTTVRRGNGQTYYFTQVPGTLPGQCVDPTVPVSGITRAIAFVSGQTRDTLTVTLNSHHQPIAASYRVAETDQIEQYDTSVTHKNPLVGITIARLRSITERNGWVTTLAYSTSATQLRDYIEGEGSSSTAGSDFTKYLLLSVTNAFGRQLRFAYTAQGHLSQLLPPGAIKDSAAGAATSPIRYAYKANGSGHAANSLERVTWQDGTSKQYHYEAINNPGQTPGSPALLTGITDEAGVRTDTYRYDTQGRVVEEYGAPGADGVRSYHLSFGYTIYAEVQTTVTDHVARNSAGQIQADNRSYRFARVAAGSGGTAPSVFATTLTAPCSVCGGTGALTINGPYNQPIKAVAHDGSVTFTAYDTKGRATEVATFPASQSGAWLRPALSLATSVVSTQWHATWNLPLKVAQSGSITAYTYNAKSMVTGQASTPTTDMNGSLKFAAVPDVTKVIRSLGWSYTASNLTSAIVQRETPNGAAAVQIARWTYSYNALGDKSTERKDVGAIVKFLAYSATGKLLEGIDVAGYRYRFELAPREQALAYHYGNAAAKLDPATGGITNSPTGKTTRYTYLPTGNLQQYTDGVNGSALTYTNDGEVLTITPIAPVSSVSNRILSLLGGGDGLSSKTGASPPTSGGLLSCLRKAFGSFGGLGNHAYIWDVSRSACCGRTESSGGSDTTVCSEKGPSTDSCKFIDDSVGKEASVFRCCQYLGGEGIYMVFTNDCHNTVNKCLTKNGMWNPMHKVGRNGRCDACWLAPKTNEYPEIPPAP